jgi:hypothetical protein
MDKKHCSSKKRKFEKRAINKFRRKQLKLDEIIKCNRFEKGLIPMLSDLKKERI